MDVLTIIDHARAAGLTVSVDGDRLIVKGPSSAVPLVRALGRHKAEVLVALTTSSTGNGNATITNAGNSAGSVTVTTVDTPSSILAKLRSHGLDLIVEPSGRVYLAGPPEAVAGLPVELVEAMGPNWPALRRLATPENEDTTFPAPSTLLTNSVLRGGDEPLSDPETYTALANALFPDGWTDCEIDLDEVEPCPNCGALEPWQTATGDRRCQHCDPPTVAVRLSQLAARLREQNPPVDG